MLPFIKIVVPISDIHMHKNEYIVELNLLLIIVFFNIVILEKYKILFAACQIWFLLDILFLGTHRLR